MVLWPNGDERIMTEHEIEDWPQFVRIAEALDVGDPSKLTYAFRGHSNDGWELLPSLLRGIGQEISEERALDIEGSARVEFLAQAHLHLNPQTLPAQKDAIGWWTLMQHHGAPTRLLDWTESFYVAAYFAVAGQPESAGAIWCVQVGVAHEQAVAKYKWAGNPETVREIEKEYLQSGAPQVVHFLHTKLKTNRVVVQQGLFSICRNVLGDHGAILEETMPAGGGKMVFQKFVIPAHLKTVILRRLRNMNITANSLFPGLDG